MLFRLDRLNLYYSNSTKNQLFIDETYMSCESSSIQWFISIFFKIDTHTQFSVGTLDLPDRASESIGISTV